MNTIQQHFKALYAFCGRSCAVLLLLLSGIVASHAQPIPFANATVTVVSGTHNHNCGNDAGGICCGCFISICNNPEPRWRVRVRPSTGVFGGYTVLNPGTVSCGTVGFTSQIATYTNMCASQIEVEIESWEEDGCGTDNTFDNGGCANADEAHSGPSNYQINYQTGAQSTNNNTTFTLANGYTLTVRVNWTATTGGLAAPTVSNPTICSGTTALLSATNAPAAGNHFEWYSDAALTNLLLSGNAYTTPALSAATTYYVAEVSAGNCHGPVTAVNVGVNPSPTANITGTATICQNSSTTLTASGGGSYAWSTLQSGASISVSPASNQAYTVTVTAANTCTASSAFAVTVNPAPTTTPYTLCQNSTVMGGLTSDLGGAVAPLPVPNFTGNTTGAPTYNRVLTMTQGGTCGNSGVGTAVSYITHDFTAPATGSYTFQTCGGSGWDTFLSLYQSPFNPAGLCAGNSLVAADDDACPTTDESIITVNLTAGTAYTLVATGFGSTNFGAYTILSTNPPISGGPPSVEWYTAATGGSSIATGSPFNPVGVAGSGIANTNTAASTTFYAQFPGGSCRTAAVFTINPTPNTPTAANVAVCSGSNAALSATSNIGVIEWYNVSTGGAPISTGGTYNVPNATANASYWAEAVLGTCRSARVQVDITVNPIPAAPATANTSICDGSTATLSAAGTNITWWNAAAGGAQVGAGSPFTTIALNSNTDFFAQQSVLGCPSPRSLATVTVNPIPASPIANGTTICTNDVAMLNASGSNIVWYDAATGGNLLGTGNGFTTGALTATTSFYPEQTINNCTSPRTTVTVTVNPVPATPTASAAAVCTGGNGVFTATGSGTIQWYDMPAGGTLLGTGSTYNAGPLLNPVTVYVQQSVTTGGVACNSLRVPVSIVINPIPAAPATVSTSVCVGESATVSASGTMIDWYDAGGTLLQANSNTYTINPLTATTTVYAQQTVLGCTSLRSTALATAKPIPAAPSTTNQTICVSNASSLVASPDMSGTVNWYLGASLVNTGTVYNQASPAAGTYVYSVNETLNGCTSQNAQSTLTVNPLPAAPSVANTAVCSNGSTSLTATGSGSIEWFDASTGGNLLQVGNTYNTGALAATMTYYVQQTVAGCVSPRAMVTVTVNAAPSAPTAPSVAICEGSATTLTASNGNSYVWFADAVGLQQIGTGATFTTPTLSSTTIYYVQTTNGLGCVSNFTPVTVTVNALPATPIAVAAMSVCSGGVATVTVSGSGTVGNYVRVYDGTGALQQGFQITATANTFSFTTTVGTTPLTFYFGEEHGTTFCESNRTSTIINIEALPAAPTGTTAVAICSGSSTTLSVTPAGNGTVYWYNATNAQVGTGNSFTTSALTANTTYTVREQSLTGCVGANTTVTVTVNNLPNQPNVQPNNVNICRGATATINIQNPNVNSTYSWFTDAAATQPANPATGSVYTSNPLNNSTTIYVQTTNANGCKGPIRAVPINVASPVVPPVVLSTAICSGAMATLTGTNTNNNTEWYNNPQGNGTPLFTGDPYVTGALTANTTIYAFNVSGQGCRSTNTSVDITVNAIPTAPILAGDIICAGQSTILLSQASGNVTWYNDTNTLVGVGPSYNTGVLTLLLNTYTSYNEVNGCRSLPATVTVRANPIPAAPAATATPVCRGNAATLTVQAPVALNTYTWYADAGMVTQLATGTTFTTTPLNNTTTYYLHTTASGCSSPLVAVTAQVQPLPPTPTAVAVNACLNAPVTITATNGNPTTEWYDAPTGGTLVFTGNPFATSFSATGTTTLFISNIQGTCRSASTPVNITVNPNPAPATVTGVQTICSGNTTTLTADGGSNTIVWLNVPGFSVAALGTTFTTPALQANTTFAAISQDANNCTSFSPVSITVNPTPPDAQATAAPVCAGQAATLNSTSGPGTTWYADATGSTALGTGVSFTTAPLQQTTTFYVAVNSPDGCRSNIKPVTVVVNALPNAPSAVDKTACEGTTVTLTAINGIGIPRWYNNPNGTGSAILGTSITTPTLSTTITYYIANVVNGCNSLLNPVTVTVNPTPPVPTPVFAPDPDYCIGETIVGLVQGTGGTLTWHIDVLGFINVNQTGELFTLNTSLAPVPPGTYTFDISETKNGCKSPLLLQDVTLHQAPSPAPFAATTAVCEGAPINIASGLTGNFTYQWTLPNGSTQTTADLSVANANVADHQGFYTFVVTEQDFGCVSEPLSVYQEVNTTPTGIVIQTNSPLCPNTSLALNTPLIGNASYAWTGPNGFTSTTRNNVVPNVVANGTYDVVVTVDGCASVPASADIMVFTAPAANAGADATIPYGATTTLSATGGFGYNWSPALLLTNSSTQSPSTVATLPVGTTVYTVTVADQNGCTATDEVSINVTTDPAPNSFMDLITPNGDGANDEWHLPFLANLDGYTLSIYARAGNLVYTTTNYDQKWTGTHEGNPLPDGAYWFILALKDGKTIKGAVTIKR